MERCFVRHCPGRTRVDPLVSSVAEIRCRRIFYKGAVVKHAKFGLGTIQRSEGEGDDLKISVSFPGYGVKTLAVKFAKLEVV